MTKPLKVWQNTGNAAYRGQKLVIIRFLFLKRRITSVSHQRLPNCHDRSRQKSHRFRGSGNPLRLTLTTWSVLLPFFKVWIQQEIGVVARGTCTWILFNRTFCVRRLAVLPLTVFSISLAWLERGNPLWLASLFIISLLSVSFMSPLCSTQ